MDDSLSLPKPELPSSARSERAPRQPALWPVVALVAFSGLALRAWILTGPFGEVEADESIVGLMALHILGGEHVAFYWGQPYLGSLEAYCVAAIFALVGPSNLALKAIPALFFAAFTALVFITARRVAGDRAAVFSAAYLALPPVFLAVWSVKARGGYVELLALGQALIVLTPWIAVGRSALARRLFVVGLLSGLLLWTHVLGLVYIVPAGLVLLTRLRSRLLSPAGLAACLGFLLGLTPALLYNIQADWETVRALSTGGSSQAAFQQNLATLLQVGLPVLVGLGQATSSPILFAQDWPTRPGSWPWVPPVLFGLLVLALLPALGLLRSTGEPDAENRRSTVAMLLMILGLTPVLASLGRFGELVAEPRYALPLYSTIPLFALAIDQPRRLRSVAGSLAACGVLLLNAYSIVSADPRLSLPTTAGASTERSRAELIEYLRDRQIGEIYTDYWLAYPLIFESNQAISAAVMSGGFNRFAPYAHFVSISDDPAFVLVTGSAEEAEFQRRLEAQGGGADVDHVAHYSVYTAVSPVALLRP